MPAPLNTLFDEYQAWYRAKYAPSIRDEDEEDEAASDDPFLGLRPVSPKALATLAGKFGRLPASYTQLLATQGAGVLLCASEDEPLEWTLLPPSAIARAQKDFLSWLGPEAISQARASQGLDVRKMVPFLTPDWTTWALLAGQKPGDDRVFLTSHDWEQHDGFDLFAGPLTLEAFFEHFFGCARKRDPLNGSYAHRAALLRKSRKK